MTQTFTYQGATVTIAHRKKFAKFGRKMFWADFRDPGTGDAVTLGGFSRESMAVQAAKNYLDRAGEMRKSADHLNATYR